ncbi:MAG: o-succinylbenzoate synthase [Tetrasphaera sp.]|nr:o-succinylbenzoate synthase [Tetrasphaera sp.]
MPSAPLPALHDVLDAVRVVRVPLRTRFRGVSEREVALVSGPVGWGEFGAFLEYGDAEAAAWLASALEAGWLGWPEPVRAAVPVNATVPAVPPDQVEEILSRFDAWDSVKVKVAESGQSLPEDVARVAAVRAVVGPNAWIRVDANGAWSLTEALEAIRSLSRYGLEYVEQPCATVAELRELRVLLAAVKVDVPIAADESVRKAADPLLVAREQAADLIVVKAAPLGGVRRALAIVAESGLPAVVSSALDTSVGLAAGAALAGALPHLEHDCGLGTAALLAADVTRSPLLAQDGEIVVRPVSANLALLDELGAGEERTAWWRERVTRCYEPAMALLEGNPPSLG